MIGEPSLVTHRPRVAPLRNVLAVERLAVNTDLGFAEREVSRIRVRRLSRIILTASTGRENQNGNSDGGYREALYFPVTHDVPPSGNAGAGFRRR